MSEWREALTRLQTDVSERPLKQDMDALSVLVNKRLKLLASRLGRLSRQSQHPAVRASTDEVTDTAASDETAAVMKRQMITDFSCLSCDKKLLFTRKQCVLTPLIIIVYYTIGSTQIVHKNIKIT